MKQKEMAGDYEILHSMRLGGKVLIIGHNPKDLEAPYMTCYQEDGFLGGYFYTDAVGSNDYGEVMKIFAERLQKQVSVVEKFRASRQIPVSILGPEHCRSRGEDENLAGKVIILRPSSLAAEYRTADCQLGIAVGGFGCSPGAGGRAVHFQELYSGEQCRWNIGDVLGIADLEKLPDWAKEKVAEYEKKRIAQKQKRGEAR